MCHHNNSFINDNAYWYKLASQITTGAPVVFQMYCRVAKIVFLNQELELERLKTDISQLKQQLKTEVTDKVFFYIILNLFVCDLLGNSLFSKISAFW